MYSYTLLRGYQSPWSTHEILNAHDQLVEHEIEHKILNAHKYTNFKIFVILGSEKSRMLFFPLINVKMPTIVGILTFMSRKNFMLR